MRELQITGARAVEWRDVPAPAIEADVQALVRPLAVALCDLDSVFLAGTIPVAEPFAMGHECVAEVIEVGDSVTSVVPGDRVLVPFQISCGECPSCRAGHTGSCSAVPRGSAYGMKPLGGDWGGALADSFRVPFADAMLLPFPDAQDPAALASVADNVPDAFRTVAGPLERAPGSEVLVVGGFARSIGIYTVACAVALGSSRVVYADSDPGRLAAAEGVGAEVVEIPAGEDGQADWPARLGRFPITVDGSGDHGGLHTAIRSTAANGECTSVAIYFEAETPVPLLEMYTRCCTFHAGRVHSRATIPAVLDLITAGRLDPGVVTSAVVPFDDAVEAMAEPPTKLVLTP
ncbi:MAG: hypothetical protein QOG62_938 [Thermoleophilaceae bacterium]|nr:hypothetical protein [Thermoleophilaceae bacterium]